MDKDEHSLQKDKGKFACLIAFNQHEPSAGVIADVSSSS